MSFTRMRYHFVTATHERRPWLTDRVRDFVRGVMRAKAEEVGGKLLSTGGVEDHEHIVAAVRPRVAPAEFIGKLKSESSRRVRREFPSLGDFSWQEGYGGFTLWPLGMRRIIDYVDNQQSHHRRRATWDVIERVEE